MYWYNGYTKALKGYCSLFNTQSKERIKGKWSNPRKRVEHSSTPRCSSYRKEGFRVTLEYGRLNYIYIYIYIHI